MHSRQGSADETGKKWVVVQLTSAGERETDIKALERSVSRILRRPIEVFVPAMSQDARDESQTTVYMAGYIFVLHEPGVDYTKLSDTTYFASVLVSGRTFQLLDDSKVRPIKDNVAAMKVGEFKVGAAVRVKRGIHKNLPGKVAYVYDGGENVQVHVKLASKEMLIDFPSSYLQKEPD